MQQLILLDTFKEPLPYPGSLLPCCPISFSDVRRGIISGSGVEFQLYRGSETGTEAKGKASEVSHYRPTHSSTYSMLQVKYSTVQPSGLF